jgi:hypothetical protein
VTIYLDGVRFQSDLIEPDAIVALRAALQALGLDWNELEIIRDK